MGVDRALVTGKDDAQLASFHNHVGFFANAIERRKNTVFYTVMSEDWAAFVKFAKIFEVTCQQMDNSNRDIEIWNVVHQGTAEPWKPKSGKPAKIPHYKVTVKRVQ